MSTKECEKCGHPYYRRNKIEVWTGQNPGKRSGWLKEELKICNTCMPQMAAQRLLVRMDIRITKAGKVIRISRGRGAAKAQAR